MFTPTIATRTLILAAFLTFSLAAHAEDRPLPILNLPDPKIAEVYQGNWNNTLKPCICPPSNITTPPDRDTEPQRPWKVDVDGHYPGWYPGVDMKHSAAAYLACQKDLDLVLRAWKVTTERYQMPDGAIRAMTMNGNPNSVVPETTGKQNVVYYPLRLTGCIDYLLLGDMIFRFSQDKQWLKENIKHLELTAHYIKGWIDNYGLLDSDSYDLDQVYREIDGVAQAAAYDAFTKLRRLELIAGDSVGHFSGLDSFSTACNLKSQANNGFWDDASGYYAEHLTYINYAATSEGAQVLDVSSELDEEHTANKAIDGILGCGMDAFGVGRGAAGKHEWAARGLSPWIKIGFAVPRIIGVVMLLNRTDPELTPADNATSALIEFSDGSKPVELTFNDLKISRAGAHFEPREVDWIKVTLCGPNETATAHLGLSEIVALDLVRPIRRISHGMTDSNFAMLGFNVAGDKRAAQVWHYFQDHESAFYESNGLHAPTWIAEDTPSYTDSELNRRAPRKDCVAMGRTWRYDALMRYRMHDGDGLYKTITYANALYDRPSGGGAGFFAERYGLGRFQPGDESQANVPKYAEYPAVYNSTVVQQCLLGLDTGYDGSITIAPCVPASWYDTGFGIENPGLLKDRDLAFTYHADHVEGWVSGTEGPQTLHIVLPPKAKKPNEDSVTLTLQIHPNERTSFIVK